MTRAEQIEAAAREVLRELTRHGLGDQDGSLSDASRALRAALIAPPSEGAECIPGVCPRCGERGKHGCGPARPIPSSEASRCGECGGTDKACAIGEACEDPERCWCCGMTFRGPHWRLTNKEINDHRDRCGGSGEDEFTQRVDCGCGRTHVCGRGSGRSGGSK